MIFNSNKGLPPRSGLQVAFGAIGMALLGATAALLMVGYGEPKPPEKCASPINDTAPFPRTRFPLIILPAVHPRDPEVDLSWRVER